MADVPIPGVLEEPPRSTGSAELDFPLYLDWFYRAYQVVFQAVEYINDQVETGDFSATDLPDPATATTASAQQTANAAFTLAEQNEVTVADTATVDLTITDGEITADVLEAGLDHGSIGGLTDDDHTQYPLSLGRSSGQTIIGGVNAGATLTLQSTSNATKGKIKFGTSAYDEVNNRMGLGTDTPTETLDVNNDTIRIRNSKTPSSAGDTGVQGQVAWDGDYIYICSATDTWLRAAITTW